MLMSLERGSVRGRANSISSRGNHPSSYSNLAPSPMSADQYAMNLGFTTVTISRARSSDIQIGYNSTESSTPPRPSTNLIRPSGEVIQTRPSASSLSNRDSSPPPTTYS
ncbi:hypothetical protein Csa_015821 [Cucumis sativus]|uniref:Uncharacterized protein n=1 Tax=Cucumis sativus TaxID=3659 RepID=A0A0A0K595_CUCSA|nr:hypothetical protein Csa_015821 [Cucumis sativus]